MRILVIEDEELVALSLKSLLKEIEPGAEIIGPLTGVKEAQDWLSINIEPDLILSDIQLSDGVALDIFSSRSISCPIIFTTAYNEYAIKAFKLNSIDYLLKPVEKEELLAALRKYHQLQSKFRNADYLSQLTSMFASLQPSKKYKDRFPVHLGRTVTLVPVAEIAVFVKEEIIYAINKENKRFVTEFRSLEEVMELLDPACFYRANRQYIVNLPLIEGYRSDDTGKLTIKMRNLKLDDLIVAKDRAAAFRKWFE